jgi:hypothetical protein
MANDEGMTKVLAAKREWRTMLLSLLAYPNVKVELLGRPTTDYPQARVQIQLTHENYRFHLEPQLMEPVVITHDSKKKRVKLENVVGNMMQTAAAEDVKEAANAEARARNREAAERRKVVFQKAIGPELLAYAIGITPGGEGALREGYKSYLLNPTQDRGLGSGMGRYQVEVNALTGKLDLRLSLDMGEEKLAQDPEAYAVTLTLFEDCFKAVGSAMREYAKRAKAEHLAAKKAQTA